MARFVGRWWIWIAVVLIAGGAVGYYFTVGSSPVVTVVHPETRDIELVITESATVIPAAKSVIATLQGGQIAELWVEVGDQIKKGEVIARLDTQDRALSLQMLEARLASARAAYEKARQGGTQQELSAAQAQLEAAQAEARGLEDQVQEARLAYNRGAITQNEYMQVVEARAAAEARVRAAQAQLEGLQAGADKETLRRLQAQAEEVEAQLAQAQLELERSELVSPIAGTVLERPVEPGMVVAPGGMIAVVGDTTELQVEAYILAADSVRIEPGQPVRITGDVLAGKTINGRVKSISSIAITRKSELGVLQERVRVVAQPVESTSLRSGFGVDLHVIIESREAALTVPAEATFHEDGADYVLIVADNKVEQRAIEISIRGETDFEVRSGLAESDRVVLNPSEGLEAGQRVRVK